MDGTLIDKNIGTTFVKFLFSTGNIKLSSGFIAVMCYILYKLRILGFDYAIKSGAWALRGLSAREVEELARRCFEDKIQPNIFAEAIDEIDSRRRRGDQIILATGAHSSIAEVFSSFVGVSDCICTRSKVLDGRYGFEIEEPLVYREGKRDAVLHLARQRYGEHMLTVYSDEEKDLPLMEVADVVYAVNADNVVAQYVTDRGGKVISFR